MSKNKHKYFCLTCRATFSSPTAFFKDRQKHISEKETNKQNVKSKTTIN